MGARAHDRYLRGRLLQDLGREREALVWFETFGWSGFEQVYAAPARLQRALIHEGLGDPDAAARLYGRMIEIWKDADPELQPQVEEARSRLVRLGGKSQ